MSVSRSMCRAKCRLRGGMVEIGRSDPHPPDPPDLAEPLIRDYLSRCLAGRGEDGEEFVRGHGDLEPVLRRRLEQLRALGLLDAAPAAPAAAALELPQS